MSREDIYSKVIIMLGANYNDTKKESVSLTCDIVIDEALSYIKKSESENVLQEIYAIIVKNATIAFLNRGAENLKSQNELGQSANYINWAETLHNELLKSGKRRLF